MTDEELKEALGTNSDVVLTRLHRHLAQIYRDLSEQSSELDRIDHLKKFFFHVAQDPEVRDLSKIVEVVIRDIRQKVSSEDYSQLLHDLAQDDRLKRLLTKDFH